MDISEKYVLMCEKANEIQKGKQISIGDFHSWGKEVAIIDQISGNENDYYSDWPGNIWLPRQDQLQEIVHKFYEKKYPKQYPYNGLLMYELWHLSTSCVNSVLTSEDYKWSLEKLWLAFVMKELYQKQWDGENWINEI